MVIGVVCSVVSKVHYSTMAAKCYYFDVQWLEKTKEDLYKMVIAYNTPFPCKTAIYYDFKMVCLSDILRNVFTFVCI